MKNTNRKKKEFKNQDWVFVVYSKDKYELPIAVGDHLYEIAEQLHTTTKRVERWREYGKCKKVFVGREVFE